MCGRFRLKSDPEDLSERFAFRPSALLRPRYNVAPSQQVLAVVEDQGRQAQLFRWGLIPPWAKDAAVGDRLINARAETVAEKPTFRHALRRKRCLILADGFYEWKREPSGRKTPYHISLEGEVPFAFAGLWSEWPDPSGYLVRSCAIITTAANTLMQPIHHRMPAILLPEAEATWLDQRIQDPALLTPLLAPYPVDAMQAWPVSLLVNSPKNDTPACSALLSDPATRR